MAGIDDKPKKINKSLDENLDYLNTHLPDEKPMIDISDGCSIGTSPMIEGNRLYFGSCNSHVYCLNTETGEKIWDLRADARVVLSSPFLYKGLLYFGAYDNCMYAVNSKTGEVKWKFRTNNVIESSPNVYKGLLYFGGLDNYIYCLNAENGKLIWKFFCQDGSSSKPIFLNGNILFTSYDQHIYCIDANKGEFKWKFYMKLKANTTPAVIDEEGNLKANILKPEPAELEKGSILIGSRTGDFYCLDFNGNLKWKFKAFGKINLTSAWVEKGRIYTGTFDGNVYCMDMDGNLIWHYKAQQGIAATTVVVGDNLYVGCADQNVYCLDKETGQFKWAFHTGGIILGSFASKGDKLYFGSWDGNLYCIDIKYKEKLWNFQTGSLAQSTIMGVNLNLEEERIAFAIRNGMDRDLAYKTMRNEAHEEIGFRPYVGEDEKNPYVSASRGDNPYNAARRRRENR